MKALNIMLVSAATLTLAASCFENENPYNAGFFFRKPANVATALYANNVDDTVSFFSYGSWAISTEGNAGGWAAIGTTNGNGNSWNTFPVTFEQNTTGEARSARFNFRDTDHPGDASAAIVYWQYATRGDGTLGSAPDVKAITGSDGSEFIFSYDVLHRPTSLRISKDGMIIRSISLSYNDRDSLLTVMDGSKIMHSEKYDRGYQPLALTGSTDTICYETQYYSNGYPMAANNAFNLVHKTMSGQNTYYALLLGGQSLLPDSLHRADSLRIATIGADNATVVSKWKLTYSQNDNRRQSADVNQLVFGTEQCDPYQLLSLFRYTRNTSIISEISNGNEGYDVEVALNTDHSVSKMTVKGKSNGASQADIPLEYSFEY